VGRAAHAFATHGLRVGVGGEALCRGFVPSRLAAALGRPCVIAGVRWGWGLVLAFVPFGLRHTGLVAWALHGAAAWSWPWGAGTTVSGLAFGFVREDGRHPGAGRTPRPAPGRRRRVPRRLKGADGMAEWQRHLTPHAQALPGRLALGLAMSLASAAALVLAFPPYGLWPLAWVAFVPMLVAQYRVLPARISSLASAVAIGGWVWGFFGPVFGGTGSIMRYLPLAVFAVVLVLDLGLRAWHARSAFRWFVPQGAAGWVAIEMVRGLVPSFGTWGFVAHTQHGQPWLIQPVAAFGVYGLSLLLMLVNFALGLASLAAIDARWPDPRIAARVPPRRARGWLVATGLALVAWVVGSVGALRDPPADVRVAAIQPALSPLLEANRGRSDLAWDALTRMKEQTRAEAAAGAAFIV
jgi:apolipoprotein N-acyltransferase